MTPHPRTPQQRDRRFARVRRISSSVLLGSGVASGVLVGFMAGSAKPVATVTPTTTSTSSSTTTTVAPATTTTGAARSTGTTVRGSTGTTTTRYVPPTTLPTTTTTICFTNPSGHLICS